jgi:hypothetical protein
MQRRRRPQRSVFANNCQSTARDLNGALAAAAANDAPPVRALAREFHVPESTLRSYLSGQSTGRRVGRPTALTEDFELQLTAVLDAMADCHRGLTQAEVKNLALKLAAEHGVEGFKASRKWLTRFMVRHNLSVHTAGTLDSPCICVAAMYRRVLDHVQEVGH